MNNKVAFEIDNDNVSYDDFYAAAGKIKKALEKAPETVAVAAEDKVMYAEAVTAVWASGRTVFHIDPSDPYEFRKKLLGMAGTDFVIDEAFISSVLSDERAENIAEIKFGALKYVDSVNDQLAMCSLSGKELYARYDFCCNILKADLSEVSVIGNEEMYLTLFVLMAGGKVCGGTDRKTVIIPSYELDKKGAHIKDGSVVLSYGKYIAERQLKDLFNSKEIKMYNIFDFPFFNLISSGFNYESKPVKGVKISILNENGAVQPDGMTGSVIYETDGVRTASGLLGQKMGKGVIKLNPDSSLKYISGRDISVSMLMDTIKEIKGVSGVSAEVFDNRIYVLCDTDMPLEDISAYIAGKLPAAYLGAELIKATDKKFCGKVFDMSGLNKLRAILKRFEVKVDSLKDRPYSISISCREEDKKDINSLLSVSRQVAHAVFITPEGEEDVDYTSDFPEGSTEAEVLSAFREILMNDKIGLFDNFFDMGGNSIGFIRLAALIEEKTGKELDSNVLFLEPTPKKCCELLLSGEGMTDITFGKEATIKKMISDTALTPVVPENKKPLSDSIFLTGATGFLGVFLLRSLLINSERKLYCLVRAQDQNEGMERLRAAMRNYGIENVFDDKRIIPVPGDLEKEKLGISEELYAEIAENCCSIVHSGAKVDFMYTYDMLKKANVDSVREIVKLAATGAKKDLHYISTLAVLEDCTYVGDADEDFVNYDYPPQVFGYNQSKWVGDIIVQNARAYGIKANIYRISTACGDSVNGYWQENDLIKNICKLCIGMKSTMIFDLIIYLIPVDRMADMIAYCACKDIDGMGRIFHIGGGKQIPVEQLIDWIEDEGFPLETVEDIEWLSRAYQYVNAHKQDFKTNAVFSVVNKTASVDFEFSCRILLDKSEAYFEKEGVPHGRVTAEEFSRCIKRIKEEIEAGV